METPSAEPGRPARLRVLGAVVFVVAAVCVAAVVTAVVLDVQGTYGDQVSPEPGAGLLVLGAVLALGVGVAAGPALTLGRGVVWVRVVVVVLLLVVCAAPYVARRADIERVRAARASERVGVVDRTEPLAPGVADSAARMESAIADLALGDDLGPVLEGGGGRTVLWVLQVDTPAARSTYRQRLTQAGWLVTSRPGDGIVTAQRGPVRLELSPADDGSLRLTVTDDAFTEQSEES